MITSVRWLNKYLTGGTVSAANAEAVLMAQGLPCESSASIRTCEGDDTCLDVEVTSNRGDCLSHVGLAREIAASGRVSGLSLALPDVGAVKTNKEEVSGVLTLDNTVPRECPLFLVKVIKSVRVGESPAWLRALLEGAGQRPINNIVDATNFIALELGNPCHAFDLGALDGPGIVVRFAQAGEKLTTLDGKVRTLNADELVVADRRAAQSLAGVMGGAASEVRSSTRDVVLEVATWDPVCVRRAARRHQLRTTASHRYERIVDARTLAFAAERGAAMIAELGGGTVCPGTLRAGAPSPAPTTVPFRPARCTALLGYPLTTDTMVRHLRALDINVGPLGRGGEDLLCEVPPHRPDLTREVDLIEEVARIQGLDSVPVHDKVCVRIAPPQRSQVARREIASLLTGLGFYETVTFSFTTPETAAALVPEGFSVIALDDDRRGSEPALRPSVLAGLLACRRQNQHSGAKAEGGVRLYEVASVYAQSGSGTGGAGARTVEHVNIGLLLDVVTKGKSATQGEMQAGVRAMRGVVESLVRLCAGDVASLSVEPAPARARAFADGAFARLSLGGAPLGYLGAVHATTQAAFDLATPVVGAEVSLAALVDRYPPKSRVVLPSAFPGIERDVSLVVNEDVRWDAIERAVLSHRVPPLEGAAFVGTYRGAQTGSGKKSVTVRLSFRDPARTLRHDEVDEPVRALLARLKGDLAFELRA